MVPVEEFYFDSANKTNKIYCKKWIPIGEPKGILQIVHGMTEFIERYNEFAQFLANQGILVVGHDHMGHGKSVNSQEEWGYFSKHGSVDALEDIHTLTKMIKEQYKNVPYCILGHSMGSFFVRRFLATYPTAVDAAIIMGTGNQGKALVVSGKVVTSIIKLFKGDRFRSSMLDNMMFGQNNARIQNPRTKKDWLSTNESNVDIYVKTPANTFLFTTNGLKALLDTVEFVISPKKTSQTAKDMPILLVSGKEDPVGEYGAAVQRVFEMYQKIGVKDIEMKLFKNDRHEILNEMNRDEVYSFINQWIVKKCKIK